MLKNVMVMSYCRVISSVVILSPCIGQAHFFQVLLLIKSVMNNYKKIKDERPIWMLSVDEFMSILTNVVVDVGDGDEKTNSLQKKEKYIFGLQGICREFNVGHNTAQKLKDGILKDAVLQAAPGCKVIVDRDLARKLYSEAKES